MTLQNKFLERHYLNIVRDYRDDTDKFFISFDPISSKDFYGEKMFMDIIIVLMILAALMLIVFVIYRCVKNSKGNKSSSQLDLTYNEISQ